METLLARLEYLTLLTSHKTKNKILVSQISLSSIQKDSSRENAKKFLLKLVIHSISPSETETVVNVRKTRQISLKKKKVLIGLIYQVLEEDFKTMMKM